MRILSLFDGMSCGMIAFKQLRATQEGKIEPKQLTFWEV